MAGCIFCEKQDDPSGMKVYSTCNISNGEPCASCVEYLTLEDEIKKMQKSLEKRLVRRREIRENINRQHNRLVVRMPREITTYIFELAALVAVDNQSANSTPLRERETYAPLFLGAVCRAWRDVAWSMPQLWTFIYIHIPTVEDLLVRLDIARQWLSRTGDYLPLSIHFRTHDTYEPNDVFTNSEPDRLIDEFMNNFNPLMELICLHSHRWQVLCGTCPSLLLELLNGRFQGAPILRTFHISITLCSVLDFTLFSEESPPRPNSVLFQNVIPIMSMSIDWTGVTSLTAIFVWFGHVVDVLPLIPNLESLTLSGHRPTPNGTLVQHSSVIRHPKIRSLRLEGFADEVGVLLDALILPSLKHLTINFLQDANLLRKVTSFIRRSFCALVSMSLLKVPHALADILHLLRWTDSLTDLNISKLARWGDCSLLHALIAWSQYSHNTSQPSFILPKLQRLSYTLNQHNVSIPSELIRQIVDPSWAKSFPQWKGLSISWYPRSAFFDDTKNTCYVIEGFREHVHQRLLELVDSGIELFLPFKITREDILKLMEVNRNSLMSVYYRSRNSS